MNSRQALLEARRRWGKHAAIREARRCFNDAEIYLSSKRGRR